MSLANMSRAYSFMGARVALAEDSLSALEELIAQWFIDSDEGARELLREIAKDHRKRHRMSAQIRNLQRKEDERHNKLL